MEKEAQIAAYHEMMVDEKKERMLMADLDDAPCVICGELESKAHMDWLHNAAGEQGWCCKECQAEGESA